jgi:outer membrane protein
MNKLKISVLYFLLFSMTAGNAMAQIPYLGRFYSDQNIKKIEIDEIQFAGNQGNGNLYLTEKDAVEMALANNLDINVARHGKLSSYWDIALQKAAYDPQAAMSYNWHQTTTPTSSILQGGEFLKDTTSSYNFSYTQPFSTGTTLDVSFTGNKYKTSNFFAGYNPAINTQFRALFKQDLLKGFWNHPAEFEISVSRNNHKISDEVFRQEATEIIVGVQRTFWALAAASESLEVAEKAMELARMVHEQNSIRLEAGSISELEMAQSTAELASRHEALIRARFSHLDLQDQLIKLVTNLEDPHSLNSGVVPMGTDDIPELVNSSFEDLLAAAFKNRPEMKQVRIYLNNLDIRYRQSRDNLKPSLSIVGGYESYGLGGPQIIRDYSNGFLNPPIVDMIPGGLDESLDQIFSGDYKGYVAGFDFRIPIKNTAAKARNAKAKIAVNQGRMQESSAKQKISLEIRSALNRIEMNRARIEAAEAAVSAGEKRMDAENARFEAGMGTTRDLIEAQRDLLAATSTQVEAKSSLATSIALLDKAVGRTFSRFNIVLDEAISTNLH